MKILHLGDLHLGKRYQEYSFIEDQRYLLDQVLERVEQERPELVVIAGDVYDKSVPSEEAVKLFDDFLLRLLNRGLEVAVSSGNHDSAERLAFGNRYFRENLHISSSYHGSLESFSMQDEYGELRVYMLPFVKPAMVRPYFPEEEIGSYTEAVRAALREVPRDDIRKVLVAHQFVTGAQKSESEEVNVGSLDNVDAEVFDAFDYVALGHIHRAQSVGRPGIRYCGTLLKYNISEANQQKSFCFAELREKGNLKITTLPVLPLHDMVRIEGMFQDIISREHLAACNPEDYTYIVLNDEQDVPHVMNRLRSHFKRVLGLAYNNARTKAERMDLERIHIEDKTPFELVGELFYKTNGQPMNAAQAKLIQDLIEDLWREQA